MTKYHITAGLSKKGRGRLLRLSIRDEHAEDLRRWWGIDTRLSYEVVANKTRPGYHTIRFFPSRAGSTLQFEVPPSGQGYYSASFNIGRQMSWLPKIRKKTAYEVVSFGQDGIVVVFRDRLQKNVRTAREALQSRLPVEVEDNLQSLGRALNLVIKTRRRRGLMTEINQSEPGGSVTITGSKVFV